MWRHRYVALIHIDLENSKTVHSQSVVKKKKGFYITKYVYLAVSLDLCAFT